jgi:hypothetical protein
MLADRPEILTRRARPPRAMPAFSVYTLESIRAVGDAPGCLTLPGGGGQTGDHPRKDRR